MDLVSHLFTILMFLIFASMFFWTILEPEHLKQHLVVCSIVLAFALLGMLASGSEFVVAFTK